MEFPFEKWNFYVPALAAYASALDDVELTLVGHRKRGGVVGVVRILTAPTSGMGRLCRFCGAYSTKITAQTALLTLEAQRLEWLKTGSTPSLRSTATGSVAPGEPLTVTPGQMIAAHHMLFNMVPAEPGAAASGQVDEASRLTRPL